MPFRSNAGRDDGDISFGIDDEMLDELSVLAGQPIVAWTIWDDSVADALGSQASELPALDMDLYLASGIYFELYAVLCYPDLESEPLSGVSNIRSVAADQLDSGLELAEIAVDSEDDLVLVLTADDVEVMYLNVGAWAVDTWEELPDE